MPTKHFKVFAFCFAASLLPQALIRAAGQPQSAQALVQTIVNNELAVDTEDHSLWMYRDAYQISNKVTLVVQTSQGDISKTIEMDGHPLNAQQKSADQRRMQRFVTDPDVRQKQKRNQQQDNEKAVALTKMLPEGFLWKEAGKSGDETTLSFEPNPKFNPPTRESRVFAAMKGSMVVNTKDKRIVSLKGTLIKNVDFGWGLLGKLEKGGTFNVERQRIAPDAWEITATHIHIRGHALIFSSISEQQDEEKSNFKPSPPNVTLAAAAGMLNNGTIAKELGVAPQ